MRLRASFLLGLTLAGALCVKAWSAPQLGQPKLVRVTSTTGCTVTGVVYLGGPNPRDVAVVGTTCGLFKIDFVHADTPTVVSLLSNVEIRGLAAGDWRGSAGFSMEEAAWLQYDPGSGTWTRVQGNFESAGSTYSVIHEDPVNVSGGGWIIAGEQAFTYEPNVGDDYVVTAANPTTGQGFLLFDDGQAPGGFGSAPKSQSILSDATYVVPYQIDNDGSDDGVVLAIAGNSDELDVMPYQGGAIPFAAPVQSIASGADNPSWVSRGRFDTSSPRDGLVIGFSSSPGVLMGLRADTGALPFEAAPVSLGWPLSAVNTGITMTLDYDGDSFLDAVVLGDGAGTVLKGDGTSFFSSTRALSYQEWFGAPKFPPIVQATPTGGGQGEFMGAWSQFILIYSSDQGSYNLGENFVVGGGPDDAAPARFYVMSVEGAIFADVQAYSATYGVNVAGGNIRGPHPQTNGPGEAVITGPGPSDVFGPHVRAFDIPNNAPIAKVNFFGYGTLKYGIRPSAGDVDGDGFEEILTGPGPGVVFGPHVRGWNFDNSTLTPIQKINFFAYQTLKYGVNVTGVDVDDESLYDEMGTGPGPGPQFGPQVRGWNYDNVIVTPIPGLNMFAFQNGQYGANVASGDVDDAAASPEREEVVVGRGPDPNIGLSEATAVGIGNVRVTPIFTAFPTFYGCVVGGGDTDAEGAAEILVSPDSDPSASAQVKVFEGAGVATAQSFTTFGTSYGARVATVSPF